MRLALLCLLLGTLGVVGCRTQSYKMTKQDRLRSKDQIEKINSTLSDFSAHSNPHAERLTPDEIIKMSVVELANTIKSKRLTSEEATAAFLRRDLDFNPKYNAIVTYDVQAMDRARQADLALARGESWGPLH